MWKEKIIEAKKRLGVSFKAMAAKTNGQMSERQMIRLLNGESKTPFVDDVLAAGASVGLSARELFEDANAVLDSSGIAEEMTKLKARNIELESENKILKNEIDHKIELLILKDELLSLYRANNFTN